MKALEHPSLDVREENILTCELAEGSFDLVHSRWTLLHIPEREDVLRRLIALLKPGGTLFLEEADGLPIDALDDTGFRSLTEKIFPILKPRGSDGRWARTLPHTISSLGRACATARRRAERTSNNGIASSPSSMIRRSCSSRR